MAARELTMAEVAEVEAMSGLSMTEVGEEHTPVARYMAAVATVIRRRTHPEFTLDDALALTVRELNELNGETEGDPKDEDPAPAG